MTEHLSADYKPMPYRPRVRPQTAPQPLVADETRAAEYPLQALGPMLAAAAQALEATVQCPPAMAAQSVLTVAALGVQGHYDAEHPATGAAPCSLFAITLGQSGERKTTVDNLATRAVQQVQRDGLSAYQKAYAAHRNEVAARDAQRGRIKSANRKGGGDWRSMKEELDKVGDDPPPPIHPNHILSDPNAEGLYKQALCAPGSLLWNNAEAGQIIGGTGFTQENALKTAAMTSRFWDGSPQDRLRAGDPASYLIGRRLSLHWMLQPDVAAPFLTDPILCAQGIFSRALISQPETRIGKRLFREAPADLNERLGPYESRLVDLLNRPPPSGKRPNELEPHVLRWAPDAKAAWREFHDVIERAMADNAALEDHRGFGSKIAENVGRIATVLQAFNDEAAQCVTVETMLSAIEIGEYYLGEAQRLRALAQQGEEYRLAEKVRELLTDAVRWPDAHVSVPMLMRYGPPKLRRSKPAAAAALKLLTEHGWLSADLGPAEIRGERTTAAQAIWGRQ
jgi:hypothetical protein